MLLSLPESINSFDQSENAIIIFFSFLRVGSQAPGVICMYVSIFLIMEKNIPLPDNIMYLEPVEKQMLGEVKDAK